jgi:hypothetical protein
MKLSLDPTLTVPCHVTAQAEALAEWYDAHPAVRRLWAIKDQQGLSVILTLEPTMDGNDTYPAWLACSRAWMHEIQSVSGSAVQLELLDEPQVDEFEVDLEGEIVAAINWRDPTSFWKAD